HATGAMSIIAMYRARALRAQHSVHIGSAGRGAHPRSANQHPCAPTMPGNPSLTISPPPSPEIRTSIPGEPAMNVITLASRKGGSGKSTLTAHLAAFAQSLGKRCLILDADPQGSLTLWHSLRPDRQPPLENAARGIDRLLAHAMIEGVEWAFIDTAPPLWVVVQEAIRASTLVVIPARPGFFDLAAVRETVKIARDRNKPYAVVINAAPVKRDDKEAPAVAASRAK